MPRTDSDAVEEILGDNFGPLADGSTPSLTRHISTANAIVTRVITCAAEKGVTISDDEAELMEMWLAAYFYTVMDPQYKRKKTERAEGEFLTQSYLDAAKMLDVSGCLTAILERRTASVFWGGRPPSEQTDYVDRD